MRAEAAPESRGRHSPHTSGLMRLGLQRPQTHRKSNDSSRQALGLLVHICDPEDS